MARIPSINPLNPKVMKKLLQLLLGVISHLLLTSMSVAQENAGIIYGTVISESNEVMPLSTVALFKDSQIAAGIITDDEGNFILGNLDPGVYDLKISRLFVGLDQDHLVRSCHRHPTHVMRMRFERDVFVVTEIHTLCTAVK